MIFHTNIQISLDSKKKYKLFNTIKYDISPISNIKKIIILSGLYIGVRYHPTFIFNYHRKVSHYLKHSKIMFTLFKNKMRYFFCVNKLDISLAKKEIAIQRKVCYKHLKYPRGTIMIYKIQLLTRSWS